jgi:predicted thioesterase
MNQITSGLTGEHSITVTEALTAQAMGSGDLPVFATPAMIALMEAAAVAALSGYLAEGETSVGTLVEIKHLAATPLGQVVRAQATITAVEGRQITFTVQAWDAQDLVGEGKHVRRVIERERFMRRVNEKNHPT